MKDYAEELEKEIKDLEKILIFCNSNNIDKNIIFVLNALKIKKKDKLLKLIK